MTYKQWKKRQDEWSARGSNCPICKLAFRSDCCPHSIADVEEWFTIRCIRAAMTA